MSTLTTPQKIWRRRATLGLACISTLGLAALAGCESDDQRMTADMGMSDGVHQRDLGAQDRTYPDIHGTSWRVERVGHDGRTNRGEAGYRGDVGYGHAHHDRDQPGAQRASRTRAGELLVTIPGPGGDDLLAIRRNQPGQVHAGQAINYAIEVENISDMPLHDVVLTEWHTRNFRFENATPTGRMRSQQIDGQWRGQDREMMRHQQEDAKMDRSAQRASRRTMDDRGVQRGVDQRDLGAQDKTYPALLQEEARRLGQEDRADRDREMDRQRRQTEMYEARQWHINHLAPGESEIIEVTGLATEPGEFRTCMAVEYEPAVCFVTQVVQPDLQLVQNVAKDMAYVCEDVDVEYRVRNTGSGVARNVRLRQELPDGLTLANGGSTIDENLGNIGPGETVTHTVTLSANSTGQFSTRARAGNDALEATSGQENVYFARPELDVTVDAPQMEYAGRDVPVTITVENMSDVPAVDTVVRVREMDDLARVSLSTQRAEVEGDAIRIGRLGPGQSRTMTMTFHAVEPGSQAIRVAADAYCAEAVQDQIAIDLEGIEAVRLEMIDLVDPVVVGDETVYEVRVKNQGTADSINVGVTAQLPQEMSFVSGEGDSRVTARGKTVRLAPIPRLRPGELATWRIRVDANSPGKVQLNLKLTSDAALRPVNEQESTTIIEKPIHPVEAHD